MSQPDLIIHDEKDNVGVVVIETTKKGQDCNAWIMENDKTVNVPSTNEVPLGHKIALKDLKAGDTIFKYGHDIGKVVKEIKKDNGINIYTSAEYYNSVEIHKLTEKKNIEQYQKFLNEFREKF